jgi:hypothetical protein
MRIIGWLLAVGLLVIGFVGSTSAQQTQEKAKSATKVYAYYKKASTKKADEARNRQVEPAYGSQQWWRMRAERFSSGDGGSP